ncbi:MAG: HlyD family secretion protein [Kofleriaceae bacterium]
MTKLRYVLFGTVIAGATAVWALRDTPSASANGSTATAPSMLIAPGRVEPVHDPVVLGFETPGRIVAIEVEEGDAVVAGQVLARLDDRIARARLAAARAALGQAEARYRLARRGARREDLEAAKADAAAAAAASAHRVAEQARTARLGEVGAVATASVDADQAAARVAAAQAEAASARYQALAKGTRVEQIAEAAAQVELAKADVAAAAAALDHTVLRAPQDGVILRRTAELGAIVTAMVPAPIVTMADLRQLEIRVEIDEADIGAISVGQRAYATADAYPGRTFDVRIARITRELGRKTVRDDDPRARVDTRVLEVIARFATTPDATLPVGLRTSVHVGR